MQQCVFFRQDGSPEPASLAGVLRSGEVRAVRAISQRDLLDLRERLPGCQVMLIADEITGALLMLMEQLRAIAESGCVMLLVRDMSAATAVAAMRAGASDLLPWSASVDELRRALMQGCAEAVKVKHTSAVAADCALRMVGSSRVMASARQQIERAAHSDSNVLITGESGTGKEVAAELIHRHSARSKQHFVALNCAAIPDALLESELFGHERGAFTGANNAREGKLQYATGGSLFLDEIGDMPLQAQAKILRAIESRVIQRVGSNADLKVDARLIAATNQDLELLTHERKFRQDLYFRLNVIRIALPPLRDRAEDIPELVAYMLISLSKERGEAVRTMDAEVIRCLQQYTWPGNVRELRNVVESALVFSSTRTIVPGDIDERIRRSGGKREMAGDERGRIVGALSSADWNREKAADTLRCSRMTLYRKMMKYAIPARPA